MLALGHSGVTAWSGESGVSCHYRDTPPPPGTNKGTKTKVATDYETLFLKIYRTNQFTGFKYKKERWGRRVATSHVFSLLITMAELILSLFPKCEAWFYEACILSFLNFKF